MALQLVYRYVALNGSETVESQILASSEDDALEQITKKGLEPIIVEVEWKDSFSTIISSSVPPARLAMFYRAFGARVGAGLSPDRAARLLVRNQPDARMRIMLSNLEDATSRGRSLGDAMLESGFPNRDSRVISLMNDVNKLKKSFNNLADDANRIAEIKRKIRGLLFEPMIIGFASIFLVWADFAFLVPRLKHFFSQLNDTGGMPAYVQDILNVGVFFKAHEPYSSIVYFVCALALVIFLFSPYFKKLFLLIPAFNKLSIYADQATIWSSFYLLYDSTLPPDEIARMISSAATRKDSKEALDNMAEQTSGGGSPGNAVLSAGFPDVIAMLAGSALSSPGKEAVLGGLEQLNEILRNEVLEQTQKVANVSLLLSLLFAALIVLFLAGTTIIPMLLSVISQA